MSHSKLHWPFQNKEHKTPAGCYVFTVSNSFLLLATVGLVSLCNVHQ